MNKAQQQLKLVREFFFQNKPLVIIIFLFGITQLGMSNLGMAAELQTNTQTTTTIPTPNPANLPAITDGEVIALAKDTAISVFNYNYQNFQQKLQQASKNFTATGWQTFSKALDSSNNLSTMQQYHLTMVGQITGEAKIIKHNLQNNEESWNIEIPMEVAYTTPENKKLVHNYRVQVGIIPVDKSENSSGIAVIQFIAKPDVEKH
jgi:hypothetical protein